MRYINTTNDNITFTDVDGRVVIVPKNRVYTHFKNDTITFLLVERYDKEGICLFTTLAEDLQINGVTYTYEQLLNGEGTGDMFSPTGLIIKLVDELPASGEQSTIYLIANDKGSFTEYLWLEETSKWEELGDVSKIDLSNYFTKSEINAMFANYYTQSDIDDMFDGYYTKTEVDDKLDLKANAAEVYTKTEADNKFLTEHQSLDNYYTKDEVYNKTESDAKYATQTVVNEEIAARIQRDSEIEQTLVSKADKSDTYTKQEVDDAIANVDVSDQLVNYETIANHNADKATLEASIALKANSADLATVATSGSYDDLSDKPTIPTVPTNVSAFTNDAGYLTQHQDISNLATKTELNAKQDTLVSGTNIKTINGNSILGEGNIEIQGGGGEQVQADWNQTDDTAVDYIKNKPVFPDTSEFVTKEEYNPKEKAITEALTDLNENKADKTEIPDVSTFATKTELNAKQDALVSGTNIKTINNESILGEGNIEIQGGGGGMDEDTELLISSALVDLNDRKIDATKVKENYQKKGDYATNTKVDTKANISDVPTNEDYEEAQKITSWSLNELNKRIVELEARVAQLEA